MIRLAVIGDPIEHSLSPVVHGAALDALGEAYEYERVRVIKGGLPEYLEHARKAKTDGFNLTMPHKVDILPYLAEKDGEAELFNSVNTVCVRDGKLYGHNTDGVGYRLAIERLGYSFEGSRVVILGAGGVVRTLALAAAVDGARSLCVLNRTEDKAKHICDTLLGYDTRTEYGGFSGSVIAEKCADADILINATPLGMSGCAAEFEDLEFLKSLPQCAFVSDLIYNPPQTRFLAEAERLGHKTQNGLAMLIYQALAADEFYLGRKIDKHGIYKTVADKLKGI